MYCKNCGHEVTENSKFCKNCGIPVHEQASKPQVEKIAHAESSGEQQKLSPNSSAIFFVLLVLIGVPILYYIFHDATSNNSTVSSQNVVASSQNTATSSTFYTQTIANARSCGSTACNSLGQYPVNTDFNLPYTSINDLPDWLEISTPTKGTVYISKTVLGLNKVMTSADTTQIDNNSSQNSSSVAVSKAKDLPSIVSEWRKSTAYVECLWYNPDSQLYFMKQSGSGLLFVSPRMGVTVITNKHVVYDQRYGVAQECDVAFPDDKNIFYSVTTNNIPAHTLSNGNVAPQVIKQGYIDAPYNGLDEAVLYGFKTDSIGNQPAITLEARAITTNSMCTSDPEIGQPLVILGYPSYGSNTSGFDSTFSGIEVTATEGIISGNDAGYYTTSAKIEHGNSGGLAIDEKRDCYLGIPTAAITGQIESLGRIIPVKDFIQ